MGLFLLLLFKKKKFYSKKLTFNMFQLNTLPQIVVSEHACRADVASVKLKWMEFKEDVLQSNVEVQKIFFMAKI